MTVPLHSDPVLARALDDAQRGQVQRAMESVQLLLRTQPSNADALQVLGMLLTKSGRAEQAVHHLERAVAIDPGFATYRNNLGNALLEARRHQDAAIQFREAIRLDERYWRAWQGLATALQKLNLHEQVLETGARAQQLRPDWPSMTMATAGALEALGRVEDAIALLRAALARSPGSYEMRAQMAFFLNYTGEPPETIAREHSALASCVPPHRVPAATDPDPDRRLRIGLLSGDLRTHSAGYFALPLAWAHPDDVDIICFATNPAAISDPVTAQYRALSSAWVECATMSDEGLDAAIRAQRIDVLVDLAGHTGMGRLPALSRKPAPVIVNAIGYPNTTGHPCVDWRIVDSITDPLGSEGLATERLLRVDPCFLSYVPPSQSPVPAMPADGSPPTFGSFNLVTKISEETASLWAGAMRLVPESRLLLKCGRLSSDAARETLLARLERAGIDRGRIELLDRTRLIGDHLSLYSRVHVALDPTPYNGTTTTCEALWMGVPVVTMTGACHAARVSTSLLSAAGLREWVAPDRESFARIAAGLAADRARLSAFRADARRLLQASALLDGHGYSARVHAALRRCWSEWCAAQAAVR